MLKKTPVKKLSASNEVIMQKLVMWLRNSRPWGPTAYSPEELNSDKWKEKVERYSIETDQWTKDRDAVASALQSTMIGFVWVEFAKLTES